MIREDIVKSYVKGKDVLDVGAVGQTRHYNLWEDIKVMTRSLTGIDIAPSPDKDIVQGNMETYSFGKKFDVIVLGDVIEHVDNQGLLLDNLRRHLKEDGVIIMTTPNAKWPTVFLPTNPTHTLWHDKRTISAIVERHGFSIAGFRYYYGNKSRYNPLVRLFIKRQQMLVICKLKKEP